MSTYFYASPWIERAAHLRGDAEWMSVARDAPESLFVPVMGDRSLVRGDEQPVAVTLTSGELDAALRHRDDTVFLGQNGETTLFAVPWAEGLVVPGGEHDPPPRFVDLRQVGPLLSPHDAGLLAYARGILHWHSTHRFCGTCGAATGIEQAGYMRRCTDEQCGRQHFPRTDPAIIVRVTRDDRILLGRQAAWPARWYSVLAGFVEPGESLEEAVRREVAEETGVRVGAVSYFGSQPWPFPASLMIGFTAEAETEEISLGQEELEDARWLSRDEIAALVQAGEMHLSTSISISRRLIDDWLEPRPEAYEA